MNGHMTIQITFFNEDLTAHITVVKTIACMHTHVSFQISFVTEKLTADFAFM